MRSRRYISGKTREAALAWQDQLRSELFQLLHLGDLRQASIDFDERLVSQEERSGYTFIEYSIASTPTRRIAAAVTLPATAQDDLAAVVCLHGHKGDRFSVHAAESIYKGFATELARRGYATIAVDVGQHEVFEDGRLLMGERLWDCMRAVDWLAAHDRVDASRIGCAGLSLGGEMAMWLGAMDPRIAAEVSAGFLTTMDQMEQNHCKCWKFDGLRELVDYADIYALTGPRMLQCQNGLQEGETMFHVPLAQQTLGQIEPAYRDMGAPDHVSLHVHPGAHEVDLPALLDFFDGALSHTSPSST